MKLELKHLAPYLPYDLKIIRVHRNWELNLKGIQTDLDIIHNYGKTPIKFIKPILRPLSDLTKIDNRSGLDLITLSRFVDNGHNHSKSKIKKIGSVFRVFTDEIDDIDNVSFSFSGDFNTILGISTGIPPINYNTSLKINNWLLKNHFDVFGLIEKGLAIDINTLK